jgi:RNA 3'-terminal phosphate cyclase
MQLSIGTSVTAIAVLDGGAVLGADALGERGKRAEDVGREAGDRLGAAGAPVDEHLADSPVPWLAIRGGASRLTAHARTNCWLVERFLAPRSRSTPPRRSCARSDPAL